MRTVPGGTFVAVIIQRPEPPLGVNVKPGAPYCDRSVVTPAFEVTLLPVGILVVDPI